MTDEQTIEELKDEIGRANYLESYYIDTVNIGVFQHALDLINRQKAENERLRAELDKYPVKTLFDNNSVICSKTSEDYDKLIMDISNNAIKEFARELKCGVPQETGVIRCKDVDDLVKKITEVQK